MRQDSDTSVRLLRRRRERDASAAAVDPVRAYDSALERLSDEDREAVVLRVDFEVPYGEIARIMGKPSAEAAQMAVGRALVRLAREMGRAK